MSRLNRKRKASCEREANKSRNKKICQEQVAKTLLTLNCHTGKSTKERAAAMTLLDLSSEPVVNSGEPDGESNQEFEPEERTEELPEPIEPEIQREPDGKVLKDCSTQVSETLVKTEYIFLAVCTFYVHNKLHKYIHIYRRLKVLAEPTKDVKPKGSLRIHSPDSANDKIELKDRKWTTFGLKR